MKEHQTLIKAGFRLAKVYHHDGFTTFRFKKGCLEIEFTYYDDKLISRDATIDECVGVEMDIEQIKALDKLINK